VQARYGTVRAVTSSDDASDNRETIQ
jgi:hypothetical protein